jgi:PAS domain S-box-containing protein
MDQDLSHWLHENQAAIQERWWEIARQAGGVSEALLERLTQDDAVGSGSFRLRVLASLAADKAPDPNWTQALARELKSSELQALWGALRQALFEFLSRDKDQSAEALAEGWRELEQCVGRTSQAVGEALDARAAQVQADQEHWQTLYNMARELSASIDLNYVLQKAIMRIQDAMGAGSGAVLLLDSDTEEVVPRASRGWPDVYLNLSDLPLAWQQGHGNLLVLKPSSFDKGALRKLVGDKEETVVAVPLLANGQFHGVLVIARSDDSDFSQRELDLVEAAGNHIAGNIGSSQVVHTLSDQARELGLMLHQQQKESSQRQAILASIADGVVVNDQDGEVIMVNRAAELILNTPARNLRGRDLEQLFEVFTSGAREEITKAMNRVLANPRVLISPDAAQTVLQIDNRVINAHFAPVVTGQDQFLGIVTIFRDITKEVEADRAKSDFVSTVSHELRTPMTSIKGYTDLIFSGAVGEINENQKRFLNIIKKNTDRLTALINDLLDISRIESGKVRFEPEAMQLGDIIGNVIETLAAPAEQRDHQLSYRIEAGLPEIKGDPHRLTQVFTNLVGNAINYTPEGGTINVDVYSVRGAVRADVRDNGIGMRSEDLSKIFERFYRVDHPVVQESAGTGLGLPLVKMFIEMHGGRVWAESEMGKGSTFTVILPLPTETDQKVDIEQIWAEATTKIDRRMILLADDDRDIAELVRLHLESPGYQVTAVGRGVEVLEMARRHNPDLIILDILLPDMDGLAVLETLKSEPATADIPVLMLSVMEDDGAAFELGAAGYLTKPIHEDGLLATVEAAFARRGRVLVVEDDVDTIEMMRVALRRVGYTVDVAAEGYEAVSLARRWRPQVILLDLRLPGMDGYEILTHLKRSPATRNIPIIVASAHVADAASEEKRLQSMGVVSFMPKPFSVNSLVEEIDRVTGVKPTPETVSD